MKQLGFRWMGCREVLYWGILLKFVDQMQASLKSDKNNDTLVEDLLMVKYLVVIGSRN
jgi:hypothetical protein